MKHLNRVTGKVFYSGIMLLFFTASVFAQQKTSGRSAQAGADKNIQRIDRVAAEVSMTPEQKQNALKLDEAYGQKIKQLRTDSGDDKERFQAGRKTLRAEHEAKFRALLTKEQLPKYDAFLEKEKQEMKAKREEEGSKAAKPEGVDKSGKPVKTPQKAK